MTPERKEEIKHFYELYNQNPYELEIFKDPVVIRAYVHINELLDALEEEQQRVILKNMTISALKDHLTEAQQTIAWQREALEEIKSEGAYAGNNKYYHIASAALKEGDQP